jgi:hypothetical protein
VVVGLESTDRSKVIADPAHIVTINATPRIRRAFRAVIAAPLFAQFCKTLVSGWDECYTVCSTSLTIFVEPEL